MPWRLILFVICLVLFAVFAVVNTNNTCTIEYLFGKAEEVPVVIALVVSFTAGVIITLPFVFFRRSAKKTQQSSGEQPAMSRVQKKAAKRKEKNDSDYPELSPADDELIKEKLGMESPRGRISLK